VRIKRGSTIKRGQFIATVGNTGNVRGNGTDASHLHFEVHRYNRPVNPLYHLN
jgi:murein DD-endopeptidase MepM/ murein hydrolase activator NlpD